MKKQILVIALSIITLAVNATIWRVSQDDSYLPHFKTVQAAVDGANAGDTIYVYPGGYYESINISKQIVLIGAGYLVSENVKDSLTRFTQSTEVNISISFKKGSNYSKVTGIHFSNTIQNQIYCDSVSNIEVSGCYVFGNIKINESSEISIIKNRLIGAYYFYGPRNEAIIGEKSRNVLIANNIINSLISFNQTSEVYLKNNLVYGDIGVSNSTIENNILMGNNFYFTNCWSQYNVIKTGSNYNYPLNNSIFATLEQVYPNPITTDHYQLPSNSIAKGKGEGGIDCGPFGGDDPYQISGVSAIPSIVDFNVKAQANEATGLKMRIKIKANK